MLKTTNDLDKKIVMVTGGAGYIGSRLLRRLLQNQYKVICVDYLRYGGNALLDVWGNPDFVLEKIDITNYNDIDKVFNSYNFQAVVHLAAIVGDPACKLEPDRAREINRDAAIHLIEQAMQRQVKKFVFVSTCSNYGKMNDMDKYVDETSPLAPVSLYAELKVDVEDFLLNRIPKNSTFCPTALRFATAFGVSPRMRFDLTVNEFVKEIALGKELRVFGEQFWRPYCHVNDFSSAILAVLYAADHIVANNVFNVGDTSQNFTKKMIVDEILKQVPDGSVKYVYREEDPRNYRVSFDKIKKELDFKISKTVPQGIKDILMAIRTGVIKNPNDQKHYNIPIEPVITM